MKPVLVGSNLHLLMDFLMSRSNIARGPPDTIFTSVTVPEGSTIICTMNSPVTPLCFALLGYLGLQSTNEATPWRTSPALPLVFFGVRVICGVVPFGGEGGRTAFGVLAADSELDGGAGGGTITGAASASGSGACGGVFMTFPIFLGGAFVFGAGSGDLVSTFFGALCFTSGAKVTIATLKAGVAGARDEVEKSTLPIA
jgi:hypothetical protein